MSFQIRKKKIAFVLQVRSSDGYKYFCVFVMERHVLFTVFMLMTYFIVFICRRAPFVNTQLLRRSHTPINITTEKKTVSDSSGRRCYRVQF